MARTTQPHPIPEEAIEQAWQLAAERGRPARIFEQRTAAMFGLSGRPVLAIIADNDAWSDSDLEEMAELRCRAIVWPNGLVS